ncbi:FapA family protein [Cellulosilyticum sp. I15G10I2]|uniref:FapA family protein n=1 Tax=Cellulosilyticum sp. I15G10I2 TaxID=1892843 RepID=UPI00085C5ACA|nr:FapA family protein [Cellulosilyticum sp. I15G10I2]
MSEHQSGIDNSIDSAKPVNEIVVVEISRDRMLAVLWFEAPKNGGNKLTGDQIRSEIDRKGIKKGLDLELLDKLVLSRQYDYKYIVAKGMQPENGKDAVLTLTFDADSIKNFRPKQNQDGTVDFKNLNVVHNVKKGEILATKIPATEGVDGYNVLDQSIRAKKGKDTRMPKGKNTELSEDNLTLLASVDGKLEYDGHNIYINTVYTLNGDLDSGIGNIDFLGSVSITGSVKSGYTIKAEGSVEVKGPVEDAIIIAGGDIILSYGIQGTEKGKLVSGGNIVAKFIQNATVEARKDVITEAIIHSHVSAGNSIKVETGKGTIVGGSVAATNMIFAKSIGSPMGTVTSVQIGILPSLYQNHKKIEAELQEKRASLTKVEQSIKFLLSKSKEVKLDMQKQIMLQKLSDARRPLIEEIETLKKEYDELSNTLREAQDGIIKVVDIMHPGVRLMIGNTIKYVDDSKVHCTIRKVDGDIHIGL